MAPSAADAGAPHPALLHGKQWRKVVVKLSDDGFEDTNSEIHELSKILPVWL